MRDRAIYLVAIVVLSLIPSASHALEPYSQHFEDLIQSSPTALSEDGWLVYGNVFTPDSLYMYGYGPYPAPNHSLAFSQIALGEGGEGQGEQVLTVFSDYENLDHANGNLVEANVYQEQTIGAADIGTSWRFVFEHKLGNIEGISTAQAFIKTLDPDNGYATTNHLLVDMTSIPDTWGADSLEIFIDASLENQLLQIGFACLTTSYVGSGIFYDNLTFGAVGASDPTIEPYAQDFEGLVQADPDALGNDGWLVFGNVYAPDQTHLYSYGPFSAPNHNLAFCQIVLGEGGEEQGDQVLSVFSDYENLDHANGNLIESNVYREQAIGVADVGTTWRFKFDHKRGNIDGNSTAHAFIKTLDPNNEYITTRLLTAEMTSIPDTWGADSLQISIDATLEGQILQFGFNNMATNYEASGIFYDNVILELFDTVDVPEIRESTFATLSQNAPNPFDLTTRIDFALERSGPVELSVLDISGRRGATLARGERTAGGHQVVWDGLTTDGSPAPSGMYWYVLRTEVGEKAGSMILTK